MVVPRRSRALDRQQHRRAGRSLPIELDLDTKNAAIDAERAHVQRTLKGEDEPTEKTEVPTFDE